MAKKIRAFILRRLCIGRARQVEGVRQAGTLTGILKQQPHEAVKLTVAQHW